MALLQRYCFLWEACKLVHELPNDRPVIMNQQHNTVRTPGGVTGTDPTKHGATVSLVQMFLGFKEDALFNLTTTTWILFRIANFATVRTTAKMKLRRRLGCQMRLTLGADRVD
jgi:hypothetical protein